MDNKSKSIVALAQCDEYDLPQVKKSIQKTLEPFGGISRFVKFGAKVLLKPNMLTTLPSERAVTTHPCIVKAVAELVRDAGGVPVYGDSPGIHTPEKVAKIAGFDSLGIPLADFKTSVDIPNTEGVLCKNFSIAAAVREADVIINIPKLKTHGQMVMTCAVKNMFGCITGLKKAQFHLKMKEKDHFAVMLLDLYKCVKPTISIVDGIIAMEGNGPGGGGTPKKIGLVAAATDAVALDVICAQIIGLKPDDIPYLKTARRLRVGISDTEHIELCGEPVEQFKQVGFKLPDLFHNMSFDVPIPNWVLRKFFTSKPVINCRLCKKCFECVKICPAEPKALTSSKGEVPVFDYNRCIRCFCCQEICPHSVITIKPALLSRFIG